MSLSYNNAILESLMNTWFGKMIIWWIENLWIRSWEIAILFIIIFSIVIAFRNLSPVVRYFLWMIFLVRLCIPVPLSFFMINIPGINGLVSPFRTVIEKGFEGIIIIDKAVDGSVNNANKSMVTLATFQPNHHTKDNVTPPSAQVKDEGSEMHPQTLSYLLNRSKNTLQEWNANNTIINRKEMKLLKAKFVVGLLYAICFILLIVNIILKILKANKVLSLLPKVNDELMLKILRDLCDNLNLKRKVVLRLYSDNKNHSPISYGVFNPCIVIPKSILQGVDINEIKFIFAHELVHIKNNDPLRNVILEIIKSLYFFHPFTYFADRFIRQEGERFCDDKAIDLLNIPNRVYARYLVDCFRPLENFATTLPPNPYERERDQAYKLPLKIIKDIWQMVRLFICCVKYALGKVNTSLLPLKDIYKRIRRLVIRNYKPYQPLRFYSIFAIVLTGIIVILLSINANYDIKQKGELNDSLKTVLRDNNDTLNQIRFINWLSNPDSIPQYKTDNTRVDILAKPETKGLDPEYLEVLIHKMNYFNLNSISVYRYGKAVFSADKHTSKNKSELFGGCAPGIISSLIGIAIEEGHLQGTHQTVGELFPNLVYDDPRDLKKKITLKNLLAMNSGLATRDNEDYNFEGINTIRNLKSDWVQYVLNLPLRCDPGERFEKSGLSAFLLSAVLSKYTGMSALEYAEKKLFKPLDIRKYSWEANHQGISIGWGDLLLSPHDIAKIGMLYLQKGRWNNKQLIPQQWVIESLIPTKALNPQDIHYGYQWAIKRGEYFFLRDGSHYVFVAPGLDLVAVITSNLALDKISIPKHLFEFFIMRAVLSQSDISHLIS